MALKKLAENILEFCIPPLCISCGAHVHQNGLICEECWKDIHMISDPCCNKCGIPLEFEIEAEKICNKCLTTQNSFDRAKAVYSYSDIVIKLVSNFKYNRALNIGNFMASRIGQICTDLIEESNIVVPVPIHKIKLIQRGYNQAAEIGKLIAKTSNKNILLYSLQRDKHTVSQAKLDRKQRLENIKGCFSFADKDKDYIKGKTVLLVDDVMTTGATANECARVLKEAGAKKVNVVVFARTGLGWRQDDEDKEAI